MPLAQSNRSALNGLLDEETGIFRAVIVTPKLGLPRNLGQQTGHPQCCHSVVAARTKAPSHICPPSSAMTPCGQSITWQPLGGNFCGSLGVG